VVLQREVWTSGSQFSDIGEIITRFGSYPKPPPASRCSLVEHARPGVEIRPLRR